MNARTSSILKNIVLAVDGSEDSWAAVDMLCDMPISPAASIHALSVLIPREASLNAWALEGVLEQTLARLKDAGANAAQYLLTGHPAEEVMGFCEKSHPDLIVMGATGLRATLGILLGGVAQQIVEYACCPVLIVRAPYTGLKHILLVVDGSYHSDKAVEYISHYPLPEDSELCLMNVLPPMFLLESMDLTKVPEPKNAAPGAFTEVEELALMQAKSEENEGKLLVNRMVGMLHSSGLKAQGELKRGDAATEIIETIQANEIDLVVAGSRGLSQVQGWLLGSVSRKLVHYAGCSVMVVKQPSG